jgi:hypothetical protein
MTPPRKRSRATESSEEGRKKWLKELRAICDRKATVVAAAGHGSKGNNSGLEILRLYLRDVFSEVGDKPRLFPMKELECRHQDADFRPSHVEACYAGGTIDKGKAQGFVLSDFKKKLRRWLVSCTDGEDLEAGLSDEDKLSSEEEEVIQVVVPEGSQVSDSSWDPLKYPSSTPVEGSRRRSTKARLMVLTYLHQHSATAHEFREAFKALTTSDDALLHLCGCGLGSDASRGCITGSHLKLASLELNRDHTHVHFTLRLATTGEGYQSMLQAIRGSRGGEFDDVF